MDSKKTGKLISELRKEHDLTQDELARMLYTSRENVSKWERGVTTPTAETLIKLSDMFNVSVKGILAGDRTIKDDADPLLTLESQNTKLKRNLKILILEVIILLLAFLSFYFINNYKTMYVYLVTGESEKGEVQSGLLVFTKDKSYLKLGTIKTDSKYLKYEVYYQDKEKKTIYESSSDDYLLISVKKDKRLPYKDREKIINNTYLQITYKDRVETIKLNFVEDYSK